MDKIMYYIASLIIITMGQICSAMTPPFDKNAQHYPAAKKSINLFDVSNEAYFGDSQCNDVKVPVCKHTLRGNIHECYLSTNCLDKIYEHSMQYKFEDCYTDLDALKQCITCKHSINEPFLESRPLLACVVNILGRIESPTKEQIKNIQAVVVGLRNIGADEGLVGSHINSEGRKNLFAFNALSI